MGNDTTIKKLDEIQPFEKSFEQVYSEYFKSMYLFARSLAKSDEIAKDVVADVFFNLWKSQSDFTKIKDLKSYLFRAVRNQVIKTLSQNAAKLNSSESEEHLKQIEKVNPEEVLLEKELILLIEQTVQKLPDQCRLIFDLAKNKQMSYSEIALELGVSQSTVKTQVARAIAAIKRAIEEQNSSKHEHPWTEKGLNTIITAYVFASALTMNQ